MRAQTCAVLSLFLLVLVACQKKEEPAALPAKLAQDKIVLKDPVLPNIAALRVTETMARDLLTKWVDAQNRGDFAAYEAVYGEPFLGIKRMRSSEKRFDRKSWLVDRRELFNRNPHVTVSRARVTVTEQGAVVRFDQTWATARFRDIGSKQLVLRVDDNVLKVGREEMLVSRVGKAYQGLQRYSEQEFAFVMATAAGPGPVLGRLASLADTGELSWLDDNHAQASVVGPLSEDVQALVGKQFDLYSDTWKCRVSIQGIVAVYEGSPLRAIVESTDAKAQLKDVRDLVGDPFLVGRPKVVAGNCRDSVWARGADLTKPIVFSAENLRGEPARAALRELGKLGIGRKLQQEFEGTPVADGEEVTEHRSVDPTLRTKKVGAWYLEDPHDHVVRAFEHPLSRERYLSVEASAGSLCGSGWGGWAFTLFKDSDTGFSEVVESATVLEEARSLGDHDLSLSPTIAIQLTPGSLPVFTDGRLLYAHDGNVWRPARVALGPRFICHC